MDIDNSLNILSQEANDLWITRTIPVLQQPPSPLEFYRDWVSQSRPCIIENVINDWPALRRWDYDYLTTKMGEQEVSVAVTPNGYADAIYEEKFVMPEERKMRFRDALDILYGEREFNGVVYLQKQCSCFLDEYLPLHGDAPLDIEWATQAFGQSPDAVNFWIGDKRAITSTHKDQYENLYCVVSGTKTFTLLPPIARSYLDIDMFPVASYKENSSGVFEVVDGEGQVPWIREESIKNDLRPIVVEVKQGQTLFLPSLWYHKVEQTQACIAVNYWYDMKYDAKFCYFKFLESLAEEKKRTASNTS